MRELLIFLDSVVKNRPMKGSSSQSSLHRLRMRLGAEMRPRLFKLIIRRRSSPSMHRQCFKRRPFATLEIDLETRVRLSKVFVTGSEAGNAIGGFGGITKLMMRMISSSGRFIVEKLEIICPVRFVWIEEACEWRRRANRGEKIASGWRDGKEIEMVK